MFFVLALVLITIEGARISVAQALVERALITALDSTWAEFYGPLMEEYHVLGLDSSYGTSQEQDQIILDKIKNYITYTISPNYNLHNNLLPQGVDLYNIEINSINIIEKTRLMEYDGSIFINEAVEFMKYKEMGDLIKGIWDKILLIDNTGKVSELYSKKQKLEEEMVQIDKNILRLMTLLDGVKTGNRGLLIDKNGQLMVEKYFVKKIYFRDLSMEKVGINNEIIYKAIQNQYVDLSVYFNRMDNYLTSVTSIDQYIRTLEDEYYNILQSINLINIRIFELGSMQDKTEGVIRQIDTLIEEKDILEDRLRRITDNISFYNKQLSKYKNDFLINRDYVEDLINKILPLLKETLKVLKDITDILPKVKSLIDNFELMLLEAKEDIDKNIFIGLEEGLQDLKRYLGNEDINGYDFDKMIRVTEGNLNILSFVTLSLESLKQSLSNDNYESSRYYLNSSMNELIKYNIWDLSIDYSTLVLQEVVKDPIETIGNLIKDGIISLVMDPNIISDSQIEIKNPLPSQLNNLNKSNSHYNIGDLFLNMRTGNDKTDIGDALEGFQRETGVIATMGQGINDLAESFLFLQYLLEHFYHYDYKDIEESRKPSELSYELEYLIIGKDKDRENITSIITKFIFIRTILNFISILGDSNKRREAKIIATTLVGFTGLSVLVNITQTIMMFILGFIEALVDTCGLLAGKAVPILKKSNEIIMTYGDVFLINYNYIKEKAALLQENGNMAIDYKDFIKILLFMQDNKDLAFRSMDLIQENLQIRYENNFNFHNCYYGLKVSLEYTIHSKFTRLSLLEKISSNYTASGYLYETKASYSY